jgi:hypothetical protein
MVMALVTAGYTEEAQSACDDLLAAADATDNPGARSFASLALRLRVALQPSACGLRSAAPRP